MKPKKLAQPVPVTAGEAAAIIPPPEVPPIIDGPVMVEIKHLKLDKGTQHRFRLDEPTIERYAEAIREAKANAEPNPLPPVEIVRTPEGHLVLCRGFHRTMAHRKAHEKVILANIRSGTLQQAIAYAAGDNAEHGLPRSNKDKEYAVRQILSLDGAENWSNVEIARLARVSEGFVRSLRDVSKSPAVRTVKRGGKEIKVDVSRIGKSKDDEPLGESEQGTESKGSGPSKSSERKAAAVDSRISLQLGKLHDALGSHLGEKVVSDINAGRLPLTPKDVKEWAALKPETIRAIEPLVTGEHKLKPWDAYEFVQSEVPKKLSEHLEMRALSASGLWEYEDESMVVTVRLK